MQNLVQAVVISNSMNNVLFIIIYYTLSFDFNKSQGQITHLI